MKSQYLLLPVPSDVSYFSNYSCDIYDPISLCNSDVDALKQFQKYTFAS